MAKKAAKKVEKKPAAKAAAKPAKKVAPKVAPAKVEKSAPKKVVASSKDEVVTKAEPKLATPKPMPMKAEAKVKPEAKKKVDKTGMSDDEAKWWDLHGRHQAEKAQAYDMKAKFESSKPLMHKVLGWGWILSNENDRLEVLFKDGRKILISNYQR